jgi:hypothetical protein
VLSACDRPAADPMVEGYEKVASGGLLALCEVNPASAVTGSVGVLGGTVTGSGVSIVLPAGAVSESTEFHLYTPSSPYAEVEITANGQEHFRFNVPVVISIDYDDCGAPTGTLGVWHIDPESKTLLEFMGGVNDVLNRRVVFSTMHLSGYAIAN